LAQVNPAGVRQRLLLRLVAPQRFRIRLPHVSHPPPLLWGLGEVVMPSAEALPTDSISPVGEVSGCDIEVFTNDTFKLQQCLMALGTAFQILEPEWFQDHMAATLTRIQQLYHSPVNFHPPLLQQPAGAFSHSPPPVAYATALPSTNGHQPKGSSC
jgi:hypothetical protein